MLHIKPYLPGDSISLDPSYLSVVVCMWSAIKRESWNLNFVFMCRHTSHNYMTYGSQLKCTWSKDCRDGTLIFWLVMGQGNANQWDVNRKKLLQRTTSVLRQFSTNWKVQLEAVLVVMLWVCHLCLEHLLPLLQQQTHQTILGKLKLILREI